MSVGSWPPRAGPSTDGPAEQGLIEPLSERELDVLRLLATDLDGPDIARGLMVSLNTMRTHTKNIYAKLGVNSRRAAVRRAEELNLLPRTRSRRPLTAVHGSQLRAPTGHPRRRGAAPTSRVSS